MNAMNKQVISGLGPVKEYTSSNSSLIYKRRQQLLIWAMNWTGIAVVAAIFNTSREENKRIKNTLHQSFIEQVKIPSKKAPSLFVREKRYIIIPIAVDSRRSDCSIISVASKP